MKVQGTLIIRTFRGVVASSIWTLVLSNSLRQDQPMTFQSTSTLVNPQIARLCFRPIIPNTFKISCATATTNSAEGWPVQAQTVRSVNTTPVVKGSSEHNHGQSSRENTNYPRPQEVQWQNELSNRVHPRPETVPWQKELSNNVHFIGKIGQPVQFKYTQSGKASARTKLVVNSGSPRETMWLSLVFWNELAETAAQHLKENDSVCVSGFLGLQSAAGEADKLQRYQVVARTLNFIQKTSPVFSQQAVVSGYKTSQVKSFNSRKNALGYADHIESLWQEYFSNPLEWWDNRKNKNSPKYPDFKHKGTGEVLWIGSKSNPPWVRSQLAVLDERMKTLEEWGNGQSSARFQG